MLTSRPEASAARRSGSHRNHEIVPLSVALENMPNRQTSYAAMLDRMAYQRLPPSSWTKLLAEVRAFIDPLFATQPHALDSWDPATQTWTSLGEWRRRR